MIANQARAFSAKVETPEAPGKIMSGRKHGNPSWYNQRFLPSQGNDGNFFEINTQFRHADGFEPKQTMRDPSKFKYSDNFMKSDYWEWRMRGADYFYQIGTRLHRSNDAWTRVMIAWTSFAFLMTPHAFIWKFHVVAGSMVIAARIRDKGAEPTVDEIHILDTIFANKKLA